MQQRFQDKVAVVTGGASGIGEATVRRLVSEGARVMVADLQQEAADTLALELGDAAAPYGLDVTDLAAVEALMADTAERFGKIDIVFNNAGISSLERWRRHREHRINLWSVR